MEPVVSTRTELHAVRVRRAELRETLNLMEAALAAPARGRAVIWGEAVHASLVMLADDFGAHVEVTEGPGGLHQSILAGDLRLANAVEALTGEHGQLAEEIATLVADGCLAVGHQLGDLGRDLGVLGGEGVHRVREPQVAGEDRLVQPVRPFGDLDMRAELVSEFQHAGVDGLAPDHGPPDGGRGQRPFEGPQRLAEFGPSGPHRS